ncbi:MAG: glycosyltransferase family 39 protein [Anaerolineales bacterium]|nr:glycosyltransferase family 39 protein [Anaerolineales bacterium]
MENSHLTSSPSMDEPQTPREEAAPSGQTAPGGLPESSAAAEAPAAFEPAPAPSPEDRPPAPEPLAPARAEAAPESIPPAPSAEPIYAELPPIDIGGFVKSLVREISSFVPELALCLLIAAGVYFRFAGNDWSEGTFLNPDELGVNNVVSGVDIPSSFDDYFNTRKSPLTPYQLYDEAGNPTGAGPDPGWVWGQWPIILIRAAAEGLTSLQEAFAPVLGGACAEGQAEPCVPAKIVDFTRYGEIRLLGRFLSALTDTVTLLFIFLIGARLYGRRTGLLAAALSALAATQIQQSHFMTIDNFGVMFAAMAMYAAVRAAQKGGFGWYALFGCFYGMTLASRSNFAPLGAMILVAVIIGQWERIKAAFAPPPAEETTPDSSAAGETAAHNREPSQSLQNGAPAETGGGAPRLSPSLQILIPVGMFVLAVAATVVSFRIAQPMAFREATGDTGFFTLSLNPDWISKMEYAAQVSAGTGYIAGYPPAEHWANRPALITPFLSIVLWGMGLPLGLAAFGGLIWAGVLAYRGVDSGKHALPVLFAGGMFLFLGTRWVKEMRYFLVIYPFLCLLAAWALLELWKWAGRHRGGWRKGLAGSALGVVLLGTLAWAWNFSAIYRTENTRLEASRWMYQNFPAAFRLTMRLDSGEIFQQGANFYQQQIGGEPAALSVLPVHTGTVERISLGFVKDLAEGPDSLLHVELYAEPPGEGPLASADILVPAAADGDGRGAGIDAPFGPIVLEQGRRYQLYVSAARGGPFEVRGAWFVDEAWDEGLPFNLDGFDANLLFDRSNGAQMNIEWPDVEEKRQMLIDNLSRADYVIVQSQRRIWSVCRMPAVYPLTMEYYRALFDGRLGFELAAVFQHPFAFGPLRISDLAGAAAWGSDPELPVFNLNPLAAEESFSVYDHAPVWIFRKSGDFSRSNVEAILGAVDISHVVKQDASQPFGVLNNLMLPPERLAEQRTGGTWSDLFSYERIWNKYPGLAAGMWWLWAVLTGWAALPLVSIAFGGLPDKGYSLSRIAGWLFTAWAAWMMASARVPFTAGTITAIWLAVAAAGILAAWRERAKWKEWIHEHGKTWLTMEAVFAAFFLFDLVLRFAYGDLWHLWTGGEKPMDFSYLNAVLKSTSFPPYDPWFSGGYLNYYYFGFVLAAIPIKMLATVPSIGYNLALPLLFGTLGLAAYGVAWNLAEGLRRRGTVRISPVLAGIAGAVMLAVLGNLGEVRFIWNGLLGLSGLSLPKGLLFGLGDLLHAAAGAFRILTGQTVFPGGMSEWYWNASRAIQFPPGPNGEFVTDWSITEFPFFTFLYADLHAHLIAMPLIVLALGGTLAMAMAPERLKDWRTALPLVGLTSLAIGSLWPTNTWNFPVALALALVGLVFAGVLMLTREGRLRDWRGWIRILLLGGLMTGLSVWLYQPYYDWYAGQSSFTWWDGPKTPLDSYLVIHGLFIFLVVSYLAVQTRVWFSQIRVPSREWFESWSGPLFAGAAALAAAVLILAAIGHHVLALSIPLIAWAAVLGLRKDAEDEHRLVLGLAAVSLAIICLVEIVVLQYDNGRQNTVFKFYLQAWIYLSIICGAALAWLAARLGSWRTWPRRIWIGALSLLVLAAFSYTVFGSYYRIVDRTSEDAPRSLDGMAFMPYTTYTFIDEYSSGTYNLQEVYDAVRWLQENVQGSPVIVQSPWPHYRGGMPYTIFTGLPNVLGWNYHQRQQRGSVADAWVWERDAEIQAFYETEDLAAARAFLERYDVKYVVVGQLERAYYAGPGLDKFDIMAASGELKVVFSEGQTVIYEVVT